MNTELQNKAWSILPKEFKEGVKRDYKICSAGYRVVSAGAEKLELRGCYRELEELFGYHNLTSDAEGEEMLTVKRSDVINEFDKLHKLSYKATDLQLGLNAFRTLFGSKCLPDEDVREDNFARFEPKNEGTRQEQYVPKNAESGAHSFNRILKDGFRNERRLNIATTIAAGWLACHRMTNPKTIAIDALAVADTLMAEAEKGGSK